MIHLRYMGEGEFRALRPKIADAEFVIGQPYDMEEVQLRSHKSHAHEFAWLAEAWRQLPEDLQDEYPSPEHLRKRALIQAGYYNETIVNVGDRAGALRVAAYVQAEDEFALVVTRGPLVVVRKPKSQKTRGPGAMDNRTFQASKTAVLGIVSAMIGVAPATLERETGRAA